MVKLSLVFFLLLLTGNFTFTLGRPKRRRSAADMHNAMVKFAKEFQHAVQSGSVSRAVKMAKRAKRYKDTLHFGSYAFAAVLRGEDKIVRAIFENAKGTFDINNQNKKTGGTMLHAACWAGYYKTAKFLLENGANPALTDNQGNNAAHAVLEGWNYFFLNMHGKPKDMVHPRRVKDLHGHEKTLKALLETLADFSMLDKANHKEDVPLLLAVKNFNAKALKLLLQHDGSDSSNAFYTPSLHVRDAGGRPLLNVALDTSWFLIRVSKWLTKHGNVAVPMDILQKYPKSERHDSLEMIGLKDDLLGNDVLLWNSTSYNRTKLDNVIFKWHEKNILMPLLRAGCRYTLTDKLLSTPLHVASYYGNTVAIRSLVKQYQDDGETAKLAKHLNKENAYGRTVFENAAIGGYSSAQLFLKFLQPSAENDRGTRARKKVVHYDVNADNSSLASLSHIGRRESVSFEISSASLLDEERIGGWRSSSKLSVKNLPEMHCDLDILTDENKTQFKQYFEQQKPVVLRKIDDVMKWPAFQKWTRERLKKDYGDVDFSVYARTKTTAPKSFKMNMEEYLEYMNGIGGDDQADPSQDLYFYQEEGTEDDDLPVWLVDTKISDRAKAIHTEDFKKFDFYTYMLDKTSKGLFAFNNYQFMIAPAKTGASPHFHNSALNLLVFGEKLWLLFPPSTAFYSTKHVHDWFREDLPILNERGIYPLQCRQQPGDIIYVPDMWGHGVIYTKDSIGMAHLYTG
eukprot:g9457.t1